MRMFRKFARLFAMLVLSLAFAGAAAAEEMVVIEASGVDLAPGQVVDAAAELTLPSGATVTLIGQDGTPVQLAGPFSGAPGGGGAAAAGSDVVGALARLLGGGKGADKNLGATRSGKSTKVALPDPWAIPIDRDGDYCVRSDGATFLWRLDTAQATAVVLRAADGSWEGKQQWEAGQDRLPLPPHFPNAKSQAFTLIAGPDVSDVTLHRMPAGLAKPGLRAAWLADAGCNLQAKALLAALR